MVPNALVWAVSPTNEETDELEQAIRSMLPSNWYTFRGGGNNRASQFKLPNGARIMLLSGHKPRSLKRGRVDLVLYNEGQNMSRAGWVQLRGAIADTGGLVIIAANPPDSEIGRWIEELHEKIRARKLKAILFKLTAATNPMVEVAALEDMADEVDELTFRREVLGEFVPIGDTVMHAWSDSESVGDPPAHLVDVTAEETKRELGRAAGYVVYKLFKDPTGDAPDEVIPWAVDEVIVEDADENDLADALERTPRYIHGAARDPEDCYHGAAPMVDTPEGRVTYDPKTPTHCACVIDASAWWQDGAHTKGRTSDRALRARGWVWLYKPQKDSDRNPDIIERCKAANAKLKSAAGRRRMFVARHLVHVIRAFRSWENKGGFPNRSSKFAHVCDAATYPISRFFGTPRVKRGGGAYTPLGKFGRGKDLRSGM
jgi:hypothetical protein